VQRWKKRPGSDDKDAAAQLADTVRNPDPVKRPQ
jgi:hypothetical protein